MNIKHPKSMQPIPKHAKRVFIGKIFDVYQWDQTMYDKTTEIFEKVKRTNTVVIFPVLNDGKILLTEQKQPGKKSFIGACGGRIDPGESVIETAKRELLEETGYKASEYLFWKAEQPTSKIEWSIYYLIAKGCKKTSKQNLDSGEKIKLKEVSFDDLLQAGRDNKFMEKEIIPDLYEALLDPIKYQELKRMFTP